MPPEAVDVAARAIQEERCCSETCLAGVRALVAYSEVSGEIPIETWEKIESGLSWIWREDECGLAVRVASAVSSPLPRGAGELMLRGLSSSERQVRAAARGGLRRRQGEESLASEKVVWEVLKALGKGSGKGGETEELFALLFAETEEAWACEEAIKRVLSGTGSREAALRAVPRLWLGERRCEDLVWCLSEASADGTSSERRVACESQARLLETGELSEWASELARSSLREFLSVQLGEQEELESVEDEDLVRAFRGAVEVEGA
jgi:hypothetical protein